MSETDWVEVAYATPVTQRVRRLRWRAGMTALEAVLESALPAAGEEGSTLALGVFGRRVPGDQPLAPGDRVEIYRPLPNDPREARRKRVAATRHGAKRS